jgi:FAD/FMN-containing dehydrogenase
MTAAGQSIFIDPTIVVHYQRRMRGELFKPEAVVVEAHQSVHMQQANRQPLLVARCLSAHDVAIAIALARELGLELAVRSGHNHSEQPVDVRSVLIDLSQLRQIIIDPLQQIARVEPGATNSEFKQAAEAHGLTTNDTILAFEIVTAEGTIITASAREHADLFAAPRGSIGTTGIVTAIIYRLRVLPPGQENKAGDALWTSQ